MWNGLKRHAGKYWLELRARGIYASTPVECDPNSDVVVVSQLYHPDLTMYLLAAKSFARHVRPRSFVVVDDGLLEADMVLLRHHLGRVEFVPRRSVVVPGVPAGGCWERLMVLARQNQDHYAVQLDSDTLTLKRPTEVLACIAQRRTFTLGTMSGRVPVSVEEASRFAKADTGEHVQTVAERVLADVEPGAPLRYVRGCAGFTGFAPGYLDEGRIQAFSQRMSDLCGPTKWKEWGSEQVASNFFAANAPDSLVLPVESYPFWGPDADIDLATFVHFFGTFRFTGGMYARLGAQVARQQPAVPAD